MLIPGTSNQRFFISPGFSQIVFDWLLFSWLGSDFQIRFHGFDQCCLCGVLFRQGFHNPLINRAFRDDMLHHHGIGLLPLPPEAGIGLLVKFQGPGQSKPRKGGTPALKVQPVSRRCRVNQCHWKFPCIPSTDAFRRIQPGKRDLQLMEPRPDPFQVVPEPVSHQERLSSHALDDVLQGIQLAVCFLGVFTSLTRV